MKKKLLLGMLLLLCGAFTGCARPDSPSPSADSTAATTAAETEPTEEVPGETLTEQSGEADDADNSSVLIAYFTLPEENGVDAVAGASRVIVDGELLGNTEYIAQIIQRETNGDLFSITTTEEYPAAHDPLVDQAATEQDQNARPELATHIENLDDYQTIFIGFPNWWSDLPMPLYTFLEEYDFSGKTIIPFNTHGGSSFSDTISTIAEYEPDAMVVRDGFTVSRDAVALAAEDVIAWLTSLGLELESGAESASADPVSETQVRIEVGGREIIAELNDSEIAKEFAASLPQTISMSRVRDREYYGPIQGSLETSGEIVTSFTNGDLAYWFSGNSLAVFFDQDDVDGNVDSGIIVLGRVISDLTSFYDLGSSEEMVVSLVE